MRKVKWTERIKRSLKISLCGFSGNPPSQLCPSTLHCRMGIWNNNSTWWQTQIMGCSRENVPCPSQEETDQTTKEDIRPDSSCWGEGAESGGIGRHKWKKISNSSFFCRGENQRKAGSTLLSLAGSSTGRSAPLTLSAAADGEGRWSRQIVSDLLQSLN